MTGKTSDIPELLEAIEADLNEAGMQYVMPSMQGIADAFLDFCDYLDDCGVGELFRAQMGGE